MPHADPAYYAARPNIAVASETLLAKDGMFGLHPAFEPLLPFWTAGKMAAVHATGLPAPNRSHFAAMEEVEDAAPGSSVRSGWLNRLVGTDADANPLQGLNLGRRRRARLALRPAAGDVGRQRRAASAMAGDDDGDAEHSVASARCTRSGTATPPALGRSMKSTFGALASFQTVKDSPDEPADGAEYPRHDLGRALGEVARVIKSDVGVAVLTVDQGDWDHAHRHGQRRVVACWSRTPPTSPTPSPPSSPTSARGPTGSPSSPSASSAAACRRTPAAAPTTATAT